MYPNHYIHPIYQDVERETLAQSGELKKFEFVPVRPANNDHNASAWHDPLLAKFTNFVMRKGEKKLARSLLEKVRFPPSGYSDMNGCKISRFLM